MVSAKPILKPNTNVAPNANRFSCKHNKSTVIEAGHGIKPPVKPNTTICPVVTSRLVKRFLISLACANSWADSSP